MTIARKKYIYKHLTDEMKKILDEKIKKVSRRKLYETVEYNIAVEWVSQLQNKPDAFNEIHKCPWRTTKWEYEFFTKSNIVDVDNLDLGQEMLYYIDKKRFIRV